MNLTSLKKLELLPLEIPTSLFCDHFITFNPVSALGCWCYFYPRLYLPAPGGPERYGHAHHHSELNYCQFSTFAFRIMSTNVYSCMAKGISPSLRSNRRMLLLIHMSSEFQGVGIGENHPVTLQDSDRFT